MTRPQRFVAWVKRTAKAAAGAGVAVLGSLASSTLVDGHTAEIISVILVGVAAWNGVYWTRNQPAPAPKTGVPGTGFSDTGT